MEYEKLLDWFWENVTKWSGYKASYGVLFLAVLDSLSRNDWDETAIHYDRIMNKCRLSKLVYLEARLWLFDNDLLNIVSAVNSYQPAKYKIGQHLLKFKRK